VYLKRLEIRGFKSFFDTVEINFHPGINIIVGPNGCGKSNLADAIRWVLGETNIRNLRGQKSEDVIFSGTDAKKALGMAYVEVTLDNNEHSLPVDYGEVTVGRKIFRSGESEFYLNKCKVRMKDIADIFNGTGLGKNGYSIIGQGELEQVLKGQPLDRRLLLEEASGIIKYRQQRDEVRRRITNSDNDLLRLSDILFELRQRRDEVQRKAEKAKLYLQITEECQELEKALIRFELNKKSQNLKKKKDDLVLIKDQFEELTVRLNILEKKLKQDEEALANTHKRKNKLREIKYDIDSQLNNLQNEILLSKERVNNSRERLKTATADQEKYSAMLVKIQGDLGLNTEDYCKEKEKYLKRLDEYKKIDEEISEMESSLRTRRELFEAQKIKVFDKTRQLSLINNEITGKEAEVKKAKEKRERLKIHIQELESNLSSQEESLLEIEEQKQEQKQKICQIKPAMEGLIEQKSKYMNMLQDIEAEYGQLNQEALHIENNLLLLQDMRKNMAGYSQGVKSTLDFARRGKLPGILGLIGEIISVPQGMELAVEVAAGRGLENIVVESVRHARKAIQLLKQQGLGRVTFLPLDILRVKKVPSSLVKKLVQKKGVLGIGSQLVAFEPKFEPAIEYLLGRVLFVEDIDTGIEIFKETGYPLRIVSLEGELININGAITGGAKKMPGNTPLQRRAEEKKLIKLQQQNQEAREKNRSRAAEINFQLEKLEQEISAFRTEQMECTFKYDMLVRQSEAVKGYISDSDKKKKILIGQVSQLAAEIQTLETGIKELYSKKSKLEKESELVSSVLENMKNEIEGITRECEVQKERLNAWGDQLEMKKKELENMRKNIVQFEQVRDSCVQSKQEAYRLKEQLQRKIEAEMNRIKYLKSAAEQKRQELQGVTDEFDEIQHCEEEYQKNIKDICDKIVPLKQEKPQMEGRIKSIEINIARIEAEIEGLKNNWCGKFKETLEDITGDIGDIIPASQTRNYESRIRLLQEKIAEMGPVDVGSIQECEEITKRFDFMQKQYDDLLAAKNSLSALLKETEKIMARDFSTFLLQVNESFRKTFTEIFNGGEARLNLEPQEDPLEAGVEIQVKIPGKKVQSLNLLSGGERALTCIAFIFSLLRLKPVPFCLFDEIDVSLDEINLRRFSNFIKNMSQSIQFIVITHRQAAIEAGESIYGVTMPEKGVSSVIAINIPETAGLAV